MVQQDALGLPVTADCNGLLRVLAGFYLKPPAPEAPGHHVDEGWVIVNQQEALW
jgi:hypothetical protein